MTGLKISNIWNFSYSSCFCFCPELEEDENLSQLNIPNLEQYIGNFCSFRHFIHNHWFKLYGKVKEIYETKTDLKIILFETNENAKLEETNKILRVNYKDVIIYEKNNIQQLVGKSHIDNEVMFANLQNQIPDENMIEKVRTTPKILNYVIKNKLI